MNLVRIQTTAPQQIIPITEQLDDELAKQTREEGSCVVLTTHTTCALTTGEVGEGTAEDFLEVLKRLIPQINFRHAHNPSHAWTHMAASLIGPSLTLPFQNKKLILGSWQDVLLVELDGPRERRIALDILPS